MNFHYNYAALAIFVVVLFGIAAREMTKGRTNHFYISMVVLSVIFCLMRFIIHCQRRICFWQMR